MNLEQALEAADDRLLVAVLVHLTGETRWMEGAFRDCLAVDAKSDNAGEIARCQRQLRARLTEVIATDGNMVADAMTGCVPDDDVLLGLISFVTGATPASSFLIKLKDELGLLADPRPTRAPVPDMGRIAIIGAGFSGLAIATRLKKLGIPFRLLERHSGAGGVWFENHYPRCGVDSPNHLYSFESRINPDWTRFFARRDEILKYVARTVDETDIFDAIEFDTNVRSMAWSSANEQWLVQCVNGKGEEHTRQFDVVITAVGTLNQPKYADIDSIDDFRGDVFHTARWQEGVAITGRRVGLIGNGSSGFQVGPWLAENAEHLVSFQRSPAWAAPNPRVNTEVPPELRWLLRELPFYARWHRFAMYWSAGDAGYPALRIDPDWNGPGVSEANERVRERLTTYIRDQVDGRQDLVAALVPEYPPFTKRMVVDNGWFASLTRPSVDLVTAPIVRAIPEGLVTADGRAHHLDVLIHATGFHGTRYLWPTEVRGRSGLTPAELAGQDDDIRGYLGVTMPDFPNFFSIFGPNSSIGHGGSAIHIAECQANYIACCIVLMIEQNIRTLEIRAEVCDSYNRRLEQDMKSMVWTEPGVASRYRNREGRIVTNHPWTLQRFWELTRSPDLSDFHIVLKKMPAV